MKYTQNTVAKVFKVYSGVNSIACILLLFILAGTTGISDVAGSIWIAVSIVVNFGIYAIGEVIQLLDDIKQNTAKARNDADVGSTAVVADELPEL